MKKPCLIRKYIATKSLLYFVVSIVPRREKKKKDTKKIKNYLSFIQMVHPTNANPTNMEGGGRYHLFTLVNKIHTDMNAMRLCSSAPTDKKEACTCTLNKP